MTDPTAADQLADTPAGSAPRWRAPAPIEPPPADQPVVVQVRLIGPPAAVARAAAAHAEKFGPLWQASGTPRPSRRGGADVLLYGTLIVPVSGGAG